MIASLTRSEDCAITFLRAVPPETPSRLRRRRERELRALVRGEAEDPHEVVVEAETEPGEAVLRHAADTDLVLMGIRHRSDASFRSARSLLVMRSSPVASEVLLHLVHEGPDRGLPPGLGARIAGGVQVGNPEPVRQRLHDRGSHGARHAGERIHVDDAVASVPGVFHDAGDAEARLRPDIEAEEILLLEDLLQMPHLVIAGQVDE